MNLTPLAGNGPLKRQLEGETARRGLSHAYILSGPAGLGRHTLARLLCGAMLCADSGGERPCGHCAPCPVKIDIAMVNKLLDLADLHEELPPTLYEQFVARVLESASTSATAAQKAAASAARCSDDAAKAQTAARQTYTNITAAADAASRAEAAAARAEALAPADGQVLSVNGKSGVVQLTAQELGALPCPAEPVAGALLRVLSVDPNTGALHTDTTPMPDFSPFVRSSTVPTAQTSGAVRADAQYGVSVRTDGTLTTVPADAGQLDAMTDAFAPLVPALLPYGVKKALTSASTAAGWSAAEKAAALRTLGADLSAYYTRNEADARFGAPYTLPAATADVLGGVKAGSNLTVYADGTLALLRSGVTGALGYTPAQVTAGTADLTAGSSALTTGAVYLVYQ